MNIGYIIAIIIQPIISDNTLHLQAYRPITGVFFMRLDRYN